MVILFSFIIFTRLFLVCPELLEPENTILLCDNDTATDSVNCTLHCKPGNAFDHDPKDFYICGPETLHQWDFQTDDNPLMHLPACTGDIFLSVYL